MRVLIKYKLLNLLSTVEEAITYVKEVDGNNAEEMLINCIEANKQILKKLQKENIINEPYNIALNIEERLEFVIRNIDKKDELLDEVFNAVSKLKYSIVNDIETNFKMLFMPYKRSMWDSLESIWDVAKEDSCCEASIIPIPYYELDEKLMPKKLCYEGELFGSNFDVTNFQDYNLNDDLVDVIFIHNPYDQFNRITMIDPKYFSSELKKHTSMLVYVPYYVDGSLKNKDFKSFALGALKNSDYIVTQSKNQKDSYIKSGINTDRILNMGSPKIDAVIKEMKKECKIPKEWKGKIQGKKVILLSTGISDLISNHDFINTLKNIILYFKNSKDFALIWRPHPLTKVTIEDMANESMVIDAYNFIMKEIEDSNNIVLDLNSDVYESMRISDALISDYSSILFQYIITEKPVFSIMNKYFLNRNRFYLSDYTECYSNEKGDSLDEFLDMVLNNKDYRKQERVGAFKKSMTNSEGTSGEEIYKFVVKRFDEILRSFLRSDEVVY